MYKLFSKELTKEFGRGFSRSNLQNMRNFYLAYPKCQTLSGKLTWSHYCELLSIEDEHKEIFLAGAEFVLIDEDGNEVGRGTTDTNGRLEFRGLGEGRYTLKEVKAPEGYELSSAYGEGKIIVISNNNRIDDEIQIVYTQIVENTKTPPVTPPGPPTGPPSEPQNPVRPPGPGEPPTTPPDEEIPDNPPPTTAPETDISDENIPTAEPEVEVSDDIIPLAEVPKTGVGYQFSTITDNMVVAILPTESDKKRRK